MAEVAEERPSDCYAMYTRSAKQGFAVWTLLTVWLAGTTTRSVEFEIATNAVLAAIRSNAPAHWSEEEINQDIEEVYDIRIDMMHKYPLRPDPAAGQDATTPTVRPPINRPPAVPAPAPHRSSAQTAAPSRKSETRCTRQAVDSPPLVWAGRPRRRNEELREAGRPPSKSVSKQEDHESPEA